MLTLRSHDFHPQFFVAPLAFDQPSVGALRDDQGREVFGVFSYDDGPEEPPYCSFSGTLFECNTQARAWNDAVAGGQTVRLPGSILRYF